MPETTTVRFIYSCRRIPERQRDTAHLYQNAVEELNPDEPIGGIAQNAVNLGREGLEAYRAASNLIEIEPVEEAHTDVVDSFEVEGNAAVGVDGVGDVPVDADLKYLEALWMRTAKPGKRGRRPKIAVLDTGLGSAVAEMLQGLGILKDAVSYVGGNPVASATDHGSHVATTITPDKSHLYHYQVLGEDGSGTSEAIIRAIYHAADRGVDIINMSLSGTGGRDSYERAIAYARSKGCLVFCAAGNTARQELRYPSACPSAVSVAAFDRSTDRPAQFATSNSHVDLASSGVEVLAFGGRGVLLAMSGSSMSTPLAGFVAALLILLTGTESDALLQALRSGARDTAAIAISEGAGVVSGRKTAKKLGKE